MVRASATRRSVWGVFLAALVGRPVAALCEKPPSMVLRTTGGSQTGRVAAYCWSDGRSSCCAGGGPNPPAAALPARRGESPYLDTSPLGFLTALTWTVRPGDAAAMNRADARNEDVPRPIRRHDVALPTDLVPLPNDLAPGPDLVSANAQGDGGETSQWFRLFVDAGSSDAPAPAATPTPATACPPQPPSGCDEGPPRLELRAEGGCQLGAQGSWCWSPSAREICCGDTIGIDYPQPPLVLRAGEASELHAVHVDTVTRLTVRIAHDPTQGWEPPAVPPARFGRVAVAREVRPLDPIRLSADLPPGGYLVDVSAQLEGGMGGNLHQGFRLRVATPGAAAASPVPAATPVADPTE